MTSSSGAYGFIRDWLAPCQEKLYVMQLALEHCMCCQWCPFSSGVCLGRCICSPLPLCQKDALPAFSGSSGMDRFWQLIMGNNSGLGILEVVITEWNGLGDLGSAAPTARQMKDCRRGFMLVPERKCGCHICELSWRSRCHSAVSSHTLVGHI